MSTGDTAVGREFENRSLQELFGRLPDFLIDSERPPGEKLRTIAIDRDRTERELIVDEQWQGSRDTRYT